MVISYLSCVCVICLLSFRIWKAVFRNLCTSIFHLPSISFHQHKMNTLYFDSLSVQFYDAQFVPSFCSTIFWSWLLASALCVVGIELERPRFGKKYKTYENVREDVCLFFSFSFISFVFTFLLGRVVLCDWINAYHMTIKLDTSVVQLFTLNESIMQTSCDSSQYQNNLHMNRCEKYLRHLWISSEKFTKSFEIFCKVQNDVVL